MQTALHFIKEKIKETPEYAIITGTGMQAINDLITDKTIIKYADVPNIKETTLPNYQNEFIFGYIGKHYVMTLGRYFYYEGFTSQDIVSQIRLLKDLGIKTLIITNSAGALRDTAPKGTIGLVTDYINLMGINPLVGPNDEKYGVRFPDMLEAYNKIETEKIYNIAKNKKIKIEKGIYAAMTGPCLETPAEYEYLRRIGADFIGMSTVPETIVARHCGIKCIALSALTDDCFGDIKNVGLEEIIKIANNIGENMKIILKEYFSL